MVEGARDIRNLDAALRTPWETRVAEAVELFTEGKTAVQVKSRTWMSAKQVKAIMREYFPEKLRRRTKALKRAATWSQLKRMHRAKMKLAARGIRI